MLLDKYLQYLAQGLFYHFSLGFTCCNNDSNGFRIIGYCFKSDRNYEPVPDISIPPRSEAALPGSQICWSKPGLSKPVGTTGVKAICHPDRSTQKETDTPFSRISLFIMQHQYQSWIWLLLQIVQKKTCIPCILKRDQFGNQENSE